MQCDAWTHGVVHCTVFEYDGVGFSSKSNNIEDHFAFKMLVERMNQANEVFIVRKGILKRYKDCIKQVIEFLSNKHSGKIYLANHVLDMLAQIEELTTKNQDRLRENENLKRKCNAYIETIKLQTSDEINLSDEDNDVEKVGFNGLCLER